LYGFSELMQLLYELRLDWITFSDDGSYGGGCFSSGNLGLGSWLQSRMLWQTDDWSMSEYLL